MQDEGIEILHIEIIRFYPPLWQHNVPVARPRLFFLSETPSPKMTSTLSPAHTTLTKEKFNNPCSVEWSANLLPCVIEHDGTAYWDSGLILHESVKCLFVVMTPLVEKWTCMEQHCREPLQGQWRKFGILFTDEIFVEPVPSKRWTMRSYNRDWNVRLFHLETYPFKRCQFFVWKIEDKAAVFESRYTCNVEMKSRLYLERSSRTSSWVACL
jgi:hypothetical protein